METITETLQTPVREPSQVLVVGGGIAGVAAALAAARAGADVLLLEKSALLGGLATNGLINWYEPLCDGHGQQLIYGLAEELLRLSIRYGDDTLPEIWRDRSQPVNPSMVRPEKQHPIGGRYGTFFSPTLFQLALDELLVREGVRMRLDILAAMPLMEGGRCVGVSCESKSGREFFPCRAVIDATGDADLFFRAGAPCVNGRNYLSYVAHRSDVGPKKKALEQRRWVACGADLHGVGHPQGYPYLSGTTNEEVTQFLLDGRRMLLDKLRGDERRVRDIATLPTMAQFRETRRIQGEATLTEGDCKKRREDSVGLVADFERVGDWYEIPWGCLYSAGVDNMLAVGRMISSEGWAWEVTRVIPVCALTGQAAGVAAARLCREDTAVARLPLKELQKEIAAQGVRLHHD